MQLQSQSQSIRKLHALTALRFVAAAAIVILHIDGYFGVSLRNTPLVLGQAVGFFFVLSGFILTYVYPKLETWAGRKRFLVARIARVWPAHMAAFVLLWILFRPANFPTGHVSLWTETLNIFMVQAWVPIRNVFFSHNSVSWSISAEAFFYLLFPFLIWRWEGTWWWKLPLMLAVAFVLIIICHVFRIIPSTFEPWGLSQEGILYIHPLARVFEFTLGMTTALLFSKTTRLPGGKWLWTLLEAAAIALVIANMIYTRPIMDLVIQSNPLGPEIANWAVRGPVCCVSFAILIYVMGIGRGWISRVLGTPVGVLLGEISFTVYLLHYMLYRVFVLQERHFTGYPDWLLFTFFWAVLLLSSWLIWAGVERPLRSWIVYLLSPRPIPSKIGAAAKVPEAAGRWKPLLAPSAWHWGGGLLLLAILFIPITYALIRPAHRPASIDEVAALAQVTDASIRNARFSDKFALAGVSVHARSSARGELTLAWQALGRLPLDYRVGIYLLDEKGQIISQADYWQDDRRRTVSPGDVWLDHVLLPKFDKGAVRIGISIYRQLPKGSEMLTVDRGPRDWTDHRLLIPLSELR